MNSRRMLQILGYQVSGADRKALRAALGEGDLDSSVESPRRGGGNRGAGSLKILQNLGEFENGIIDLG